ncbi:MAG: zinc-ribbon domain-containing protein [Lachnospiraceae bacterium]|nr:zinc-ribbon domain-containing protein [Lachnospiraceae bacterium]
MASHHVLYHTMANILLGGFAPMLGLSSLFTSALQIAFAYWQRCSEFTCDRAAALYFGDSKPVIDVMIRLAGAGTAVAITIDRDLYIQQAEAYKEFVKDSSWNKLLEHIILMDQSHPLTAVRAYEIKRWCESVDFAKFVGSYYLENTIYKVAYKGNGTVNDNKCPNCGATLKAEWKFCKICGQRIAREGDNNGTC